ncbi:LOW QUALITY PROTEIN: arylsulfatase B [Glossina fuscipes fuscipes]
MSRRSSYLCFFVISFLLVSPTKNIDIQKSAYQFQESKQNARPNIVIMLIDDMGYNDLSFHGSNQILTPNIDALAYNGIILNRHYVPNLCTPSRSALLTGKYPIHTGTQHFVAVNQEPLDEPLDEQLMPAFFRDEGYSTNLVGKWHLGFYRKEMTPTFRGFNHHYGYYSGFISYYDHTFDVEKFNYTGLDFRRDLRPWPEANGTYATDVFTDEAVRIIKCHDESKPLFLLISHLAVHTGKNKNPLQAPEEEVKKFPYISNPRRRTYAGMISRLDESVGKTMEALAKKGILDNTIVLLYSDNGAPTVGLYANTGSNYPFRGKESPWEGGIRSTSLLWSSLLKQRHYVSHQVMHAIDWFPTLAGAADIKLPNNLHLDGINLWPCLNGKHPPQPRRLIHVLDDIFGYTSYMRDNYKYISGTTFNGLYDIWLGELPSHEIHRLSKYYVENVLNSTVNRLLGSKNLLGQHVLELRSQATVHCPRNSEDFNQSIYKCEPLRAPCLFDVVNDPCERYNLARVHSSQMEILSQEVNELRRQATRSARIATADTRCDPKRFNGTWQWWYSSAAPVFSFNNNLYFINTFLSFSLIHAYK